jgi:hypothetical protein
LIGVHIHRGEVVMALEMLEDNISRAKTAHDLMSEAVGLFMQAFALAFHGDATGARDAGNAAADAGSGLLGVFERAIYAAIAIACLADGDAEAAWDAALRADRGGINPAVDGMNMVWMAQAALAFGELVVAKRWAYGASSGANASWRAVDLSVRARVNIATGDNAQGANDAYDALAAAASSGAHLYTADTLEYLAGLAHEVESNREAARLLGAAHAMRQRLELVR